MGEVDGGRGEGSGGGNGKELGMYENWKVRPGPKPDRLKR